MAAAGAPAAMQAQLDKEMEVMQKLNTDIAAAVSSRQQYDAQLQENTLVKQELDLLKDDGKVFKLIGPALIKQDLKESQQNVAKRIEFINNEMKRLDKSIADMEASLNKRRDDAMRLQQQIQAAAAGGRR